MRGRYANSELLDERVFYGRLVKFVHEIGTADPISTCQFSQIMLYIWAECWARRSFSSHHSRISFRDHFACGFQLLIVEQITCTDHLINR